VPISVDICPALARELAETIEVRILASSAPRGAQLAGNGDAIASRDGPRRVQHDLMLRRADLHLDDLDSELLAPEQAGNAVLHLREPDAGWGRKTFLLATSTNEFQRKPRKLYSAIEALGGTLGSAGASARTEGGQPQEASQTLPNLGTHI